MPDRSILQKLDKETLIDLLEDQAKNWLAHDGLWFQAVEQHFGMEAAIQLDTEAWKQFTQIEARRILQRLNLQPGGGLAALKTALQHRLYARINEQSLIQVDERTLRFEMNECRVQSARQRKGLPAFPCKAPGLVEYAYFAHTIDPRLRTRLIACPPDPHPEAFYCAWEFRLEEIPILETEILITHAA